MKLRLTRPAARQLERILSEIARHHPAGTRHVQERIRLGVRHTSRRPSV